jgi:hypothetical protein
MPMTAHARDRFTLLFTAMAVVTVTLAPPLLGIPTSSPLRFLAALAIPLVFSLGSRLSRPPVNLPPAK